MNVRQVPIEDTRPLRQQVLRPHQTVAEMAEHEVDGAFAVGAFDGDALVAVGFVNEEGEQAGDWRVRGMATAAQARGRGAGTAILEALIEHAQASGAQRIWCNARVPAISLYERAGFDVASDVFEPPEIGPHVKMERSVSIT